MARHSSAVRTAAGSTTLPIMSLYAIANVGGTLREVGVFNTTTTAFAAKLIRLTTTGTQGAGLVESDHMPDTIARLTAFTTHTVNPTLGDDLGYRAAIGAAIGAGVIWTFGDTGIVIPAGTANGIGIIVATGTGQVADAYMVWDE